MKTIPGIYVHSKTNSRYRVLGVAADSTNQFEVVDGQVEAKSYVVYISLTTGKMHVRDEREFHEEVRLNEGGGSFRRTRRFRLVESV